MGVQSDDIKTRRGVEDRAIYKMVKGTYSRCVKNKRSEGKRRGGREETGGGGLWGGVSKGDEMVIGPS